MSQRTLIYGGHIVTEKDVITGDLVIEDGKIASVGQKVEAKAFDHVIDARGQIVVPGAVDPHTHLDGVWQGQRTADDWNSGTRAAAAGGTTTVIDFCRPDSQMSLLDALGVWQDKARGQSQVDYSFHLVVPRVNEAILAEMQQAVDRGVTSFKVFLAYPELQLDDAEILQVMMRAGDLGALVMAHSENGTVIKFLIDQALQKGWTAPKYHAVTRPPDVEAEAVGRVLRLARLADCRVYITHVSCGEAALEVARGKSRGQRVYAETCPQYLVLDERLLSLPPEMASQFVWSPPLRHHTNQEQLWDALRGGTIDVVASDHGRFADVPWPSASCRDFSCIPNGGATIEDRVAVLYQAGVVEQRLSLSRFVELTATNPAKVFGLFPRKGTIRVGSDADLVIWEGNRLRNISAKTHHMNTRFNPFEGLQVRGTPVCTLVRGRVVFQNGDFPQSGHPPGEFVPRATGL